MVRLIERLFCTHLNWDYVGPNFGRQHIDDFLGVKIRWKCRECGKVKYFPIGKPPIQKM